MEVITLVLIFLSSVGARNIPAHIEQPAGLTLVFDGQHSYMKTAITTELPRNTGERVKTVYVADFGLKLNKYNEYDEKVGDHVNNVVSLDSDIIGNMDTQESASYEEKEMSKKKQEEELDSVVRPVEAIEEEKNQKSEEVLLEDRAVFEAPCLQGTIRFGELCKHKM